MGSWQTPGAGSSGLTLTLTFVHSGFGVSVGDVHQPGEFSSSAEFLPTHPL